MYGVIDIFNSRNPFPILWVYGGRPLRCLGSSSPPPYAHGVQMGSRNMTSSPPTGALKPFAMRKIAEERKKGEEEDHCLGVE